METKVFFVVNKELWGRLKSAAALKGVTIKALLTDIITEYVERTTN